MQNVELDLNDPALEAALEELYRKEWLRQALEAQIEQEEFARACRLEAKAVNGMGEIKREVHGFAFHDWGQKLGSYECWSDQGFLKYFDKIAPECTVKSTGTRPTIGFPGTGGMYVPFMRTAEMAPKRFSKSYGRSPAASEAAKSPNVRTAAAS